MLGATVHVEQSIQQARFCLAAHAVCAVSAASVKRRALWMRKSGLLGSGLSPGYCSNAPYTQKSALVCMQVAQSLAKAINPNNATSATVSSTQAYNTASTFTAAAAKANRVQSSLSPQVCTWRPNSLCPPLWPFM